MTSTSSEEDKERFKELRESPCFIAFLQLLISVVHQVPGAHVYNQNQQYRHRYHS